MRDAIVRILRDKAGEGGEPVGGDGKPPESKIEGDPAPDKSKDKQPDPPSNPPPKGEGDKEYDELGYEKAPKKADEKKPPEKKDPAAPPEKVENTTGYGPEEPKLEEEPKPPEEKKDPPPPPAELDKKLESLAKVNKVAADLVKQRAMDLGLEGEKLDKYIAHEMDDQQKAAKWNEDRLRAEKRAQQEKEVAYYKDLKGDPDFGGEKFDVNIVRTSKVLTEFGPEIKKRFTDNKVMIHPDLMRMLARIADHVYPDRKMVQGEPPGGKDDEDEKDKPINPLDFYGLPPQ